MKKIAVTVACVFLCLCAPLAAQTLKSMEFRNQSITDILMVLANATGTSIVPDETVSGNASFYFSEMDFETALGLFLSTNKLHYVREGKMFRVSRIAASVNQEKTLLSLKADDVNLESLIKTASRTLGKTILYDALPRMTLSVDIQNLSPAEVLEILTRRIQGFTLETKDSYFYIKQLPVAAQTGTAVGANNPGVVKSGESWSLAVEKGRFLELLADLFKKAGKEYSLLTKTDSILENLYFSRRDFDGILRLLLEQGNADYVIQNDVYYIVELQRRDVIKNLKESRVVPLRHLSVQDFPSLLPAELASGSVLKVDKGTNSLILTGTDQEMKAIIDFVSLVDKPALGMEYYRFDLRFLSVKETIPLIPQKMVTTAPFPIPQTNSFLFFGSREQRDALAAFIESIDSKNSGYPIRLKYIKTEDLLKTLPPSISKEEIVDSGYPNLLFFIGTEDKRNLFLNELASVDRPRPQIRYELLVIQYNRTRELSTKNNLKFNPNPTIGSPVIVGTLANILELKFDVVSQFGYQFASNLSLSLTEKNAQVFVDTTLNGLSGQDIKFQNTETVRYQESETDQDTGKVKTTGVTREITSGLIIGLNGWVSGDEMITMTVNATVSNRNTDSGSATNSLPSTSERIINTQVRTPSGKPIILSGLIREDTNKTVNKIPLLGDIPLLGRLFKSEVESVDKTEIAIYIVPHLVRDASEAPDLTLRLERLYNTFAKTGTQ